MNGTLRTSITGEVHDDGIIGALEGLTRHPLTPKHSSSDTIGTTRGTAARRPCIAGDPDRPNGRFRPAKRVHCNLGCIDMTYPRARGKRRSARRAAATTDLNYPGCHTHRTDPAGSSRGKLAALEAFCSAFDNVAQQHSHFLTSR
ncbi:hypothetical protein HIM_12419 [Hirsutella minnesotensis 3608]|uniref:Uncharacterized protein n=1 Tax=Hirsutella minnesotensis 3608 TaxID=1043627 RepID=A0A0F7ZW16_9HYPO|nr:hypothetical protein HIM_12419 [Hirsutella minnesotensis 3608]